MPRRIYVGAITSIVTRLDDVEMTVHRGESVDVSEEEAERLDRAPDNWAKPRLPRKEGDS
jgi:hypothetical protein